MFQTPDAARAVDLHNLRLHLAGDLGERRRAVAGPRTAYPNKEANDCRGNGADVFLEFRSIDRRHHCFASFATGFVPADQSYEEILISANTSSPWRTTQWKGRERPSTWRISS